MIIERLGLEKILKKAWSPIQHIYTLLVILIGWVFFRVESINDAFYYTKRLFFDGSVESNWITYFDTKFTIIFIIGIISSTSFIPFIKNLFYKHLAKFISVNLILRTVYLLSISSLLIISSIYLVAGTYNPFIYFRF